MSETDLYIVHTYTDRYRFLAPPFFFSFLFFKKKNLATMSITVFISFDQCDDFFCRFPLCYLGYELKSKSGANPTLSKTKAFTQIGFDFPFLSRSFFFFSPCSFVRLYVVDLLSRLAALADRRTCFCIYFSSSFSTTKRG